MPAFLFASRLYILSHMTVKFFIMKGDYCLWITIRKTETG